MKNTKIIEGVKRIFNIKKMGIPCTMRYAALLLGILVLVGCFDNSSNPSSNTPSVTGDATQVQNANSTAVSANSVILNWDLPTDSAGYLGATISEASNAGSLSDPVEVDADTTEYTVTGLEPITEYTFTIATRYTDSSKNNTTTVEFTTGDPPSADTQVQNAASDAVTTTSVTLNWDLPNDTDGYEGVTISVQSPADSTVTPVELDQNATTHEFTGLGSAIDYIFTIATRYSDVGKNNSTTVAVTTLGVPTDDTRVQSITRAAFSTTTITLNWTPPTDTRGYEGVTINEALSSGSLSGPVDLNDVNTTEYEVTGLDPATPYNFTIATRYADNGKNNSATATYMTAGLTGVQNVAFDSSATTSDSITLTWDDPQDITDYSGVMITVDNAIGDLSTPYSATPGTNTLVISLLQAATDYTPTFTFTTAYSDINKSGSSTMHPLSVTTQSNLVTNVMVTVDSSDTVTLRWNDPEDTVGYMFVSIAADSATGSLAGIETVPQGTNTLTISGLTADTTYNRIFTFTTQYSTGNSGFSSATRTFITQSNRVTNIADIALTSDSITLSWTAPEDTVNYTGVMITVDSAIGSLTGTDSVSQGTNTFTISGLTANTPYTRTFTVATQYTGGKSGANRMYTVSFTTQSNRVDNVVASSTSTTATVDPAITLSWTDPQDTVGYTGVIISASPAAGSLSSAETVFATAGSARELVITGLTAGIPYTFTIVTQYNGSKSSGSTEVMATAQNPIWSAATSGTSRILRSIAYTDGTWVTVGDSGTIRTTADPAGTWSAATSGTTNHIFNIAYGDNTWVVAGSSGVIRTTADPAGTWSAATSSGTPSTLVGVAYGDNTWVVAGSSGVIHTTADPAGTWSAATSGTTETLFNITYADSTWVTVGSNGTIHTTADPAGTWSAATSSGTTEILYGITYADSTWVTVGSNGTIHTTADPAGTWSAATSSGTTEILYDIAYADGIWVTVGDSGTIRIATDPAGTWSTVVSGTDDVLYSIAYADDIWVTVGNDGTILTAP